MRTLFEEMYHCTFGEKRQKQNEHQIQEFGERYDRLVMQGELANPPPQKVEGKRGKPKKTKGGNLVERLKKHKDEILRFLTTGGKSPFTNNQAEQDVRMMKVKQKIAGCFRTRDGARNFAKIRGYNSTMRKQGYSVVEAVKTLATAQPPSINKWGGE
jgi:hypothetical protein